MSLKFPNDSTDTTRTLKPYTMRITHIKCIMKWREGERERMVVTASLSLSIYVYKLDSCGKKFWLNCVVLSFYTVRIEWQYMETGWMGA